MDELVLRNLKRVMDAEEMKLKKKSGKAAGVDTVHSLKSALESARNAKQILIEKLVHSAEPSGLRCVSERTLCET